MKKIFKLREWLTVDEAARHLTSVLEEEVGPSDILRMGLDGHLTLSVNFVNMTKARLGRVVPYKDVPKFELPGMGPDGRPSDEILQFVDGLPIKRIEQLTEETPFLRFGKDVASIDGVWDLAMIGGERHDVEHAFQALAGGPAIELVSLEGAFVFRPDGQWANLQDRLPDAAVVALDGKKRKRTGNYYPRAGLPSDAPIVVRTTAIAEFQARLQAPPPAADGRPLGTRQRDTLLKLVIGMAVGGYGYEPEATRSSTTSEIVADLAKLGISIDDQTVRGFLKEAAERVLPKTPKP